MISQFWSYCYKQLYLSFAILNFIFLNSLCLDVFNGFIYLKVGNCCKSGGPIYTTTTSSTNCSIVSLVPSPSTYPPYISIPMLPGGGPSTLLSQGAYHIQGHQRNPHALFLTSPSGIMQGNPGHLIKNPTHIPPSGPHSIGNKSRGGSSGRSGSSSSSSSGGLNRKKGMVRGNVYQNKSRSSDSSPSSSQYSSPPQTPSPDHTKDNRSKTGNYNIFKYELLLLFLKGLNEFKSQLKYISNFFKIKLLKL